MAWRSLGCVIRPVLNRIEMGIIGMAYGPPTMVDSKARRSTAHLKSMGQISNGLARCVNARIRGQSVGISLASIIFAPFFNSFLCGRFQCALSSFVGCSGNVQ